MQTSWATLRDPVSTICAILLAALTVTIVAPGMASAAAAPQQSSFPVVSGSTAGDLGSFGVSVTSTDASGVLLASTGSPVPPADTVRPEDNVGPVITTPPHIVQEATDPTGRSVSYTVTADDAVDGPRPVVCMPASGATFPIGSTVVHCSATDTEANTSSGTFDVTVVDTTPPVLTLPADLTTAATGATGAVAQFTAAAADLVSGSTPVICSPGSGSTLPIGKTSVSCSSTDDAGNTATGSFTFSVIDYMVPEITVDAPTSVRATSPRGARVTFRASAIDPIYGAVPVDCYPQSGSLFPVGTTTVTCIAYSMPPGDQRPAVRPADFVLDAAVLPFDIVVLPYQAEPITASTPTSTPGPTTGTSRTTRPSPATGTSRTTVITSTGTSRTTVITSTGITSTVLASSTVRTTGSTDENLAGTVAPTTRTPTSVRELAATGPQIRTPLTAASWLLLAGSALVIGARSAGRRRTGEHGARRR